MPNDQSQPALSKAAKGGALNPVEAGDGLVLRIRPFNGRLRRAQADGIATLAAAHGNGLLDLSQQGTLQIRGVTDKGYPALIQGLHHMGLLDPTPQIEGQRNLLVSPFWVTGEETEEIARALTQILSEEALTGLPPGITFAVDSGKNPVLQGAAADIRIERDAGGGLILLADGMTSGKPVSVRKAPLEAIALARWFADSRVDELSMAQLVEAGQHPEGHFVPRQEQTYLPRPGATPLGAMVGLAYGQLPAETLASLSKQGGLRLTPWGMILVENARTFPGVEGLVTNGEDPLLRVVACTGAPACPRAHIETRPLAASLAASLPLGQLCHVSGCTMGCAHPGPAPLCVVGTEGGLDLVRSGRASDAPEQSGLDVSGVLTHLTTQ